MEKTLSRKVVVKYLLLIFLAFHASCSPPNSNHRSPYDRKEAPQTPLVFAEGKITTTNGIQFSTDGSVLYLSKNIEKTFENGRSYAGIFTCTYENGEWGVPERIEFESQIDAYHPVLSIDNKALFFNSRSHLDSANRSIPHNIWRATKTENGWSNPHMVAGINSPYYDSYPSLARNNNLYFNSDRPGGKGGMDIYLSRYVDGQYQDPINIDIINSPDAENDLVVDPNEQFVIFNRYIDSTRTLDLYISRKVDNAWTHPTKLHQVSSPDDWELTPTLSPDGKYFFYELNNEIMQISLAALLGGDS